VTARREGSAWVLDGTRTNVPAGLVADTIIVPASTDGGDVSLFLVPAAADGVARERQDTTSGTPDALVTLTGVRLGDDGVLGPVDDGSALRWLLEHATVAACAVMSGLAAEAVRITGEYTTSREQFGRPIATFQAVGQRAADAYVDAQGIRLTMLQAAWRLANDAPADREVAVAKYFASLGGQRVVHAAAHLHGGMGVDRDYPLHRYFLLAKQLELTLGGASRQLVALGGILAAEGPRR
jgi:alkylation response protein AidB-like acyl-CoA dehydrogenase